MFNAIIQGRGGAHTQPLTYPDKALEEQLQAELDREIAIRSQLGGRLATLLNVRVAAPPSVFIELVFSGNVMALRWPS